MFKSRNPVLSRGFAYDDIDPSVFAGNSADRQPMTVEGVLQKVGFMFAPLLAVAVISYLYVPSAMLLPAIFLGIGLGLWASFAKHPKPGVILAYAVVQGVVLGGFSALFEARYPGIIAQAVTATLLTAASVFLLYRARIVRATAKFKKIVIFATVGYVAFLLVNFVFALFGAGEGVGIYATPLGLIVAAIGAVLASAFLVLDFDAIEQGVAQQAPRENEWRAAFGLTVTLIWLYIEMLRLISLIRR